MVTTGSIVKCIKGAPGILNEGENYTVYFVTEGGNYLLDEVNPPEGYSSFSHTRFEDTEVNIYDEMFGCVREDYFEEEMSLT